MSGETDASPGRLRDVVCSAAANAAAITTQVSLYLHTSGDTLDLSAVSDTDPALRTPRSPRTFRLADPLVGQVFSTAGPLLVNDDDQQTQPLVLFRVLGWNDRPIGLVAFELSDPREPDEPEIGLLVTTAAIVEQAVSAVHHAGSLTRTNALLRGRAAVDQRLARVVQGGGLSAVTRECSALTGKPVTLFDHDERQLTSAHPGSSSAVRPTAIRTVLASRGPVAADDATPFMVSAGVNGLTRRKIVAPVVAAGESFGWLVIDEHPTGFRAIDRYVAERSAVLLASEFVVQRRVARVAWNAKTSLARQMVRGTQTTADLMASAEYLGVDATAKRVLVYVRDPSGALLDESVDQRLVSVVERRLGVEVLATRGSDGVLLLVEAPSDRGTVSVVNEVKEAVAAATDLVCSSEVIVGVSTVCDPTTLSRGYREAREVVQCIDRFGGRSAGRVLAVDDLGPARLFLANSDTSAIRGYVSDVLGPLLTGEPGMTDLLVTLQCYFDASRSVRSSAATLGVHENTIRLRLARVATATGLDAAGDANDQLSVQTALLVLRLQGHPCLPAFGAQTGAGDGPQRETVATRPSGQGHRRSA